MNVDKITAAATAFTALFVLAVPLYVEYRRRLHEAKQTHFRDMKRFVLEYLNDVLVRHYVPVVEFKAGMLELTSEQIRPQGTSATEQTFRWRPVLHVKPVVHSIFRSLGDAIASYEREKTFDHLYHDLKQHHFPQLAQQWEQVTERFDQLSQACLNKTQHIATELEAMLKLPAYDEYTEHAHWIDYLRLSNFVYERVWGVHTGALGLYQEGDHWILHLYGQRCGQGTKEELQACQAAIDKLLAREAAEFVPLTEQAASLKGDGIALKRQIEQLLLQQNLPGKCSYTEVSYF